MEAPARGEVKHVSEVKHASEHQLNHAIEEQLN
jgi:hypothetical protein